MKRLLIPLLLLLFLIPSLAVQGSDSSAPWPVIERCLTPSPRPESWSFNGTILLTGYAGIHGVNDAWATPRVLLFLGENNLPGGAVSPDDRWYADPWGEITIDEQSYNVITEVEELRVYSLSSSKVYRHTYSWPLAYWQRYYQSVYWKDNEHVIYSGGNWNFLTGDISPTEIGFEKTQYLDIPIDSNSLARYSDDAVRGRLAPDWTLIVRSDWKLYPIRGSLPVADLTLAEYPIIAWSPDSSFFAAEVGASPSRQLVFFDRTGSLIETVFDLPAEQRTGTRNTVWSSDGRYFAFTTIDDPHPGYFSYLYYSHPNTLYIADTKNHVVWDTCTGIGNGEAWSPDNTQLAVLEPGEGTKYVMVLDLNMWAMIPVARHPVQKWEGVIGWRAD